MDKACVATKNMQARTSTESDDSLQFKRLLITLSRNLLFVVEHVESPLILEHGAAALHNLT